METHTDILDPARANALQASLGLPANITQGSTLPPFYHQLYFWSPEPPENLGRDGHPATGNSLIPNLGLPRRMWAGGRLEFYTPLLAGHAATKQTTLHSVSEKHGKSGPLAFVTLQHDISQNSRVALREYQDLVYREDPTSSTPAPQVLVARTDETSSNACDFNSTLLFRYSALTFNGHRIHYDEAYSREVEHYSGLVVHGPLLAQMLMLMAEKHLGALASFSFRATSALMHTETAEFCIKDNSLWVRASDGRQCMQAEATTTRQAQIPPE
ncbi:MaoC family dehydratase N-terminal domain-containing protein [Lentibacter algarum]|uniref:FAS1-like dehydratase domain-containing protein n=1 Tax=Lentibacter algarum TaxID=576131 RepID=UPI001C0692DF|nr:MaoC family dehydratase N-terminal domain-containing protein [Lentibacter algarum]MBU2980535.1 MaoC family dehydratase N-terminal domain-containing protein [Lentibacter algarum]